MQIEFKASKKQMQALKLLIDTTTTELWYWWGAWWGKSFLWVFWVYMMCQQYPWTRRFFGRKELTNLKKTTLNSYFKLMQEYNIPDQWVLNGQDNIIKFDNSSEILLLDLAYKPSDPLYTRFGSLELTGWFIDESNEIDYQCIEILKTRLWRQKNDEYKIIPKLLETFNPDKWHVYQRYYKPRKENTLPEYRNFIPALATDNKYISENYIQQLERSDEITKQRLLYGNFEYDDSSWALFKHDEIVDVFTANIEPSNTRYLSVDVARLGQDTTVISLREWLHCKMIVKKHWLLTDEVAKLIKDYEYDYWIQRSNIIIDSDGVWWWVADQVKWCTQFVNNARAFDDSVNYKNKPYQINFANLKTQCYYKLRDLMEKRLIRIDASWEIKDSLSQELANIKLKNELGDQKIQLESKEDMKKRIGRSPDIADSIMMRMYYEVAWLSDDEEIQWWVFTVDLWNFI